jgi:hypothetical protein
VWTGSERVFGLHRRRAGRRLLFLANVTADRQVVHASVVRDRGLAVDPSAAAPDGRPLVVTGDFLELRPYQFAWITGSVPD